MPLFSIGTCYRSHCRETLNCIGGHFVHRLGCSSRPLTSSPLELGWKSSRLLSLLAGVDAIQVKFNSKSFLSLCWLFFFFKFDLI